MKLSELYEYEYTDENSHGIFSAFIENTIFPLALRTADTLATLDFMYFSRSGQKTISPLLEHIKADRTIDEISTVINKMISARYGTTWKKLFNTWTATYQPLENYRMVENMHNDRKDVTYGRTHTRTDNISHTKTGTDTDTPNETDTNENSVYGFNSSNSVPTGGGTVRRTGTKQTTYNTTDADSGTVTDADTGTDRETRNYELTRAGNIGVTSSQQLIESEIKLWSLWDIFENVVFPGLDKLLVLPIYD